MLTKVISTPKIFFQGQMSIPVGQTIEIQEIRYSYLDQAFEANKILAQTSGIRFESGGLGELYRGHWRKEIIIGELQEVIVGPEKTFFTLSNISGRNFEEYYW